MKSSTKDKLYAIGYLVVAAVWFGAKLNDMAAISACIAIVYFKAAEIKDLINETRN